jgi:hypothetical protein
MPDSQEKPAFYRNIKWVISNIEEHIVWLIKANTSRSNISSSVFQSGWKSGKDRLSC